MHGGTIADRNCVNGLIAADWGARVRQRMANKGLDGYDADGYTGDTYTTPADRIRKKMMFIDSDSSPERDAGEVDNIGHRRNNDNDDDDPDAGDDHHGPGPRAPSGRRQRDSNYDDKPKEFQLVNPRNITITTFIGKNFKINPYIKLNNQMRRLTMTMGDDGIELVNVLNDVEKYGNKKYTNEDLNEFAKKVLKAIEYDRAIEVALANWTAGIAQGFVEHGAEGGLDAWRTFYNRYISLADDMQNILIRQLMGFKQVNENDMDLLFDEIDKIREQYIKIGSEEGPVSDKWVRVAILQNLPDKVVQTLAVELKRAESVEDIYSIINIYTFDHKTGLPRGQTSPMLYLTENQTEEDGNTTAATMLPSFPFGHSRWKCPFPQQFQHTLPLPFPLLAAYKS